MEKFSYEDAQDLSKHLARYFRWQPWWMGVSIRRPNDEWEVCMLIKDDYDYPPTNKELREMIANFTSKDFLQHIKFEKRGTVRAL